MPTPSYLARIRDLVVRYGATVALDGVDVDLLAGEIHAVVGENGAGKSTLLRALAEQTPVASGIIDRQPETRVSWVPQDTDLPPDLTACEWIFLGAERRSSWGWLARKGMLGDARELLRRIGCEAAADVRLGDLPLAQRKQVQIARAVREQPSLLLVDEPTAVLGETQKQALFAMLRALRSHGTGIVYISHHLDEVVALADRVTVLRDGKRVSTDPLEKVDIATLVQRMVGREILLQPRTASGRGTVALRVSDLCVAHVEGVSFTVHAGEVVGLAGLVGAGRSEVLEAVAGLCRIESGTVDSSANPVLLPEDRALKGLVPTLSLRENLFLQPDAWHIGGRGERDGARQWVEELNIRTENIDAAIDSLSGGNQQKLLLARTLRQAPAVLLLDEPTAGVDIGAKADIHRVIRQRANDGAAVLVASSDLPELLHLCDRIVALRLGRVVGEVTHGDATEAQVGAMITGGHGHLSPD
jgi:ABC-type sugar transport system ATPase subunit